MTSGEVPDDDLLARSAARMGDRDAFGALVSRHHARVRALLQHLTRDSGLADELAAQTFLRAWEKLGSFRGDTSARFGAWLSRIAYREFLQRTRRGKLEAKLFDTAAAVHELPDAADATPGVTDSSALGSVGALDADLNAPTMTELLAPCSRAQAEVLYMNFVLELTHEEIAHVTDQPLGTVKSHISRGKQAIKAALAKENTESAGRDGEFAQMGATTNEC